MSSSTLLVTLHGPSRTLDIALPSDVAVGELLPLLLEVCGPHSNDPQAILQAGAGLRVAGRYTPLSLEGTLIDAGVCNGTLLVLETNLSFPTGTENTHTRLVVRKSARPEVNASGIGITW